MALKSPADRQVEAIEDVERIARAWYEASLVEVDQPHWEDLREDQRRAGRRIVERLLHQDVIRVGRRPNVERPLEGQTTIDDC